MSITTGTLTYSQVKARLTHESGVHEDPRNSNRQKFGIWYGWNGVPWCAIFMSWGFAGHLGQMGGKCASVALLRSRFIQAGRYGSTPKVGSLAIFNNSTHVEMVIGVYADYLVTIGGNTSRTDGSNYWGGNVSLKRRYRSQIRGYCYPRYATTATKPPTKPPAKPTFKEGPTLHSGSSGLIVKRLQAGLNKIRNARLSVDGSFGPKTLAAVKAYQKAEKITVDGKVGPTTQRHLFGDGVKVY